MTRKRHCEPPFDTAWGVVQDKLPPRDSGAAIQMAQDWIAASPRSSR